MSKKTPLPRLSWIGELALISDPNFTVDAVKVLKTYLRYLEDFPDTVFTQETAEAVACAPGVRGRPALRYVRETLGAFWRASLPPVLALPSPPEPPPKTPEEIAADHAVVDEILAGWRAFRAERRGEVSTSAPTDWNPKAVPAAVPFNRDDNPVVRAARAKGAARDAESGRQRPIAAE